MREGLDEILGALKLSGITEALREAAERLRQMGPRSDTGPINESLLSALNSYAIRAHGFSEAAITLTDIFEIRQLSDTNVWAQFFGGDTSSVFDFLRRLRFVEEYAPKIINLLVQKGMAEFDASALRKHAPNEHFDTVTVLVLEDETQFSRPARLIEVFDAVRLLYEGCATVNQEASDQLTVLSCDSGSDKSFDFLGAAKVVEQVKEIIIGLWDKVAFHKEKSFAAKMESLSTGLKVYAQIAEMQENGKLGPEEAELARRAITSGCQKFLNSGAVIPEIYGRVTNEPRQLMAPEIKLLMHSKDDEPTAPSSTSKVPPVTPSGGEEFNPEIFEEFKRFMAQRSQAAESPPKGSRSAGSSKAKRPKPQKPDSPQ